MNGNINAALILLDGVLEQIETGFVVCPYCGNQENTKDLDIVDDLKSIKNELLAVATEREIKIVGYQPKYTQIKSVPPGDE